ncbi:mannose-1-phosphate guanylyltransferase [Clostridium punense]|uniref:Mannose-1-phosphate guanylyltransferase n=1 Tax=Clostridium punense TaxID=1054297 RepID=A0ABS4K062_9CLOT|nr:mannose-1-phosphate guanylyltransferase [Clostridium punense]MBP2021174.1 mannose-1-phosphate guanylyltransferase [Clostridium punense]
MLCAVIMAGGKGTRFWPLSTEEKPKQFLNLLGSKSMIQMTVDRLLPLIPMERIFIVTGKQYVELVKDNFPQMDERNIIVEPTGRNTAPCIALAAFYIKKLYEDATMVVLPSDHLIKEEDKFLCLIRDAAGFVEKKQEALVTIGIPPTRPETGYGYIKYENNNVKKPEGVIPVERFVEKPNLHKALEYIENGEYLWNSGMFIWKCNNILKLTSKYLQNTYDILSEVSITRDDEYEEVLEKKYKEVDNISIDFGIMEKAENIFVIPGNFGWDDIGSWSALERYRDKDEKGNIVDNNVAIIDGSNNIVLGKKKPIVICGLDNLYVIESDDAIIIGKKEDMNSMERVKPHVNIK